MMKPIENVIVVGAGAVGTAVAAIINQQLPGSVSILADGERLERYRTEGFVINGVHTDFPLIDPAAEVESVHADLVIVSVKHHDLDRAIKLMRNCVGPDTVIISLMNGITSEETIAAAFGWEKVLYSMNIGIDGQRSGNVIRYSRAGLICFGDAHNQKGAWSERVIRVADFFDRAEFNYEVPEDMIKTLWFKFMVNVGINQASAVLRAPYGVFQTNPDARKVMEAGMLEAFALSKAMGIGLEEQDISTWDATLNLLAKDGMTSMHQDIEAGRKTEVEMLAGTMIHLGVQYGVPTPVNRLWFDCIRTIEAMQRKKMGKA